VLCRIMITWGLMAALTAVVKTPWNSTVCGHARARRGRIFSRRRRVSHALVPARDRTRALALFFVATPVTQILSPKISNALLRIGTDEVIMACRCITRVARARGLAVVYISGACRRSCSVAWCSSCSRTGRATPRG